MALAEAADDVGLYDRESLGDAVLQVLIKLVVIEPLKEQPGELPDNKVVSTHDPGFVPTEVHQTG
jgi:hypothetical protein